MTEQDTDLDFDFFGTTSPSRRRARPPKSARPRPGAAGGGGGRPPRRPPAAMRPGPGLTPLLRLAGLIAFAILIIVLFVF